MPRRRRFRRLAHRPSPHSQTHNHPPRSGDAPLSSACTKRRLPLAPFTGACRWCAGAIVPPRRTFCSAACVHEHRLRSDNRYMRDCVYQRDRGICAVCGVDGKAVGHDLRACSSAAAETSLRRLYDIPLSRKIWRRKHGGAVFDVDHILPVAHGGGQCGLGNLRTLCLACHKAVTWSNCSTGNKECDRTRL